MALLTDDGGLFILNSLFNGVAIPTQLRVQLCTAALAFNTVSGDEFLTADSVRLFSVTDNPVDGDGNLTLSEIGGAGYSAAVVTAAENAVSLIDGIPTAAWDEQTFNFSGALNGDMTIYGYQIAAVAPAAGNPVLFEGLLARAFKPPPLGGSLMITPQVQFGNGTPT